MTYKEFKKAFIRELESCVRPEDRIVQKTVFRKDGITIIPPEFEKFLESNAFPCPVMDIEKFYDMHEKRGYTVEATSKYATGIMLDLWEKAISSNFGNIPLTDAKGNRLKWS